ncbi:MAG: hypothetical protein IJE16_07420 [Ruminococcus sp.]|nr:hypothetical protein [Ruminococcus sp.]
MSIMNPNEIKKLLPKILYTGHGCSNCKYANVGGDERCELKGCYISRQALDYINQLEAKVESLLKEILRGAEYPYTLDFEKQDMFSQGILCAKNSVSDILEEFAKENNITSDGVILNQFRVFLEDELLKKHIDYLYDSIDLVLEGEINNDRN